MESQVGVVVKGADSWMEGNYNFTIRIPIPPKTIKNLKTQKTQQTP